MSKTTIGILAAAVGLILLSTLFGAAFVAGGSGVVLLVGLIYAFVVTKRELERADKAAVEATSSGD